MIEADKKKLIAGAAKKIETNEAEIPSPEQKEKYKELSKLIKIWKDEPAEAGENPDKNWTLFEEELKSGIKINSDEPS